MVKKGFDIGTEGGQALPQTSPDPPLYGNFVLFMSTNSGHGPSVSLQNLCCDRATEPGDREQSQPWLPARLRRFLLSGKPVHVK